MKNSARSTVREFIYLDIPKLYSLYSQVFEGVTNQKVEERINEIITGENQSGPFGSATSHSQSLERSNTTESSILHDHMYTKLEQKLTSSFIDGCKINLSQDKELLLKNPLIKVTGRAEIEDYERLQDFFSFYNELGKIITYSNVTSNPDVTSELRELNIERARPNLGKGKIEEIEKKINELLDLSRKAIKGGLFSDPIQMSNLTRMAELFSPDGYDILITPFEQDKFHYRGVVQKNWLRLEPRTIKYLYGGQSEAPWTMVGVVTHIQGTYKRQYISKDELGSSNPQGSEENPMLLDAIRENFRSLRTFERMFLESNSEVEAIVSPLAIYKEFSICSEKGS